MHKQILAYETSIFHLSFLFYSPTSVYGKIYPNRTYFIPCQLLVGNCEPRIREKRKSISVALVSDTYTPRIRLDTYPRSIQFFFKIQDTDGIWLRYGFLRLDTASIRLQYSSNTATTFNPFFYDFLNTKALLFHKTHLLLFFSTLTKMKPIFFSSPHYVTTENKAAK